MFGVEGGVVDVGEVLLASPGPQELALDVGGAGIRAAGGEDLGAASGGEIVPAAQQIVADPPTRVGVAAAPVGLFPAPSSAHGGDGTARELRDLEPDYHRGHIGQSGDQGVAVAGVRVGDHHSDRRSFLRREFVEPRGDAGAGATRDDVEQITGVEIDEPSQPLLGPGEPGLVHPEAQHRPNRAAPRSPPGPRRRHRPRWCATTRRTRRRSTQPTGPGPQRRSAHGTGS